MGALCIFGGHGFIEVHLMPNPRWQMVSKLIMFNSL